MKGQFKERLQVLDMLEKMAGEGTRNIAFSRNNARFLIDEGLKLVEENARLEAWKRETIAVESTWDVQAVGKLIGTPLGGDIRAGVQPYIERLRELLGDARRAMIAPRDEWYDNGCNAVVGRINEALSQGGQS